MTTKVQKWGNSLAVRLPKELAKKLHLHEGSGVKVEERRDTITITPAPLQDKRLRKDAWHMFLLPTKKKKENVSRRIDELLYGVYR